MLKLPFKKITSRKLSRELQAAGLPVSGVAILPHLIDENGRAMLDENGKPKKVPPYILIKGDFNPIQESSIRSIVNTHTADPKPTKAQINNRRKDSQLNRDEIKAIIEVLAAETGQTTKQLRDKIKAAMQ